MTYNQQLTYLENVRTGLKQMLAEREESYIDTLCNEIKATMSSKGDDYAGDRDRLSNFKIAGHLAGITAQQQCLSLIAVKVARLGTLLNSSKPPNNESITDSMKDLTVYTILQQMIADEPDNSPVKWWENKTFIPENLCAIEDLRFDTFRAAGSGIHIGEIAVRATHIPTGIYAECTEHRTHYQNRDGALELLIEKVRVAKNK